MILTLMTKLIYDYSKGEANTVELLSSSEIWFIPAINLDALNYIDATYSSKGTLI